MRFLFICLAILFYLSSFAQNINGSWKGSIDVSGTQLPIIFHLIDSEGNITGTWDSPAQNATGLTFSSLRMTPDSLYAGINSLNSTYRGRFVTQDSISGIWQQSGMSFPLNFKRSEADNEVKKNAIYPNEKEVGIYSDGMKISGTLLSKNNRQKLVIIIAGSGPTDRDGNNPYGANVQNLKLLAHALDSQDIASFRFDKRGIGKSTVAGMNEASLVFEDYINDAKAIFNYLYDSLGFKSIYFAGHSEGSLIGMVASQNKKVKGYISIAGAGRPIDVIINEQMEQQPLADTIKDKVAVIFNELKKGNTVDDYPSELESLFRKSVQPYITSWMKYSPEIEIKKVQCPVFIIQGDCDVQVKVLDAQNLHAANKKNLLKIIPQMSHTLKDAGVACVDQQKTYTNGSLPLSKEFTGAIINFIRNN